MQLVKWVTLLACHLTPLLLSDFRHFAQAHISKCTLYFRNILLEEELFSFPSLRRHQSVWLFSFNFGRWVIPRRWVTSLLSFKSGQTHFQLPLHLVKASFIFLRPPFPHLRRFFNSKHSTLRSKPTRLLHHEQRIGWSGLVAQKWKWQLLTLDRDLVRLGLASAFAIAFVLKSVRHF